MGGAHPTTRLNRSITSQVLARRLPVALADAPPCNRGRDSDDAGGRKSLYDNTLGPTPRTAPRPSAPPARWSAPGTVEDKFSTYGPTAWSMRHPILLALHVRAVSNAVLYGKFGRTRDRNIIGIEFEVIWIPLSRPCGGRHAHPQSIIPIHGLLYGILVRVRHTGIKREKTQTNTASAH